MQLPTASRTLRLSLLAALCASLAACSSQRYIDERSPSWSRQLGVQHGAAADDQASAAQPVAPGPGEEPAPTRPSTGAGFYRPGTGRLIAGPAAGIAEVAERGGEIKLNFQNANLLEVVKVILGDMLGATYVVDPRVQGAVTMQTSTAIARDDLLPTLELLLRMNDAAVLVDGAIYRVVPLANAATGVMSPQLGDSEVPLPEGYGVRIVPLKYVAAEEMAQILDPFVAGGNNLLRTDSKRNVIILAGNGEDMTRLLETIRIFDVDRMKGMSVAMFTPNFVDARTLGDELESLLADPENGLMAGLVRFMVIERLNGVMAITPRPEYLRQIRDWVVRLDIESGSSGRRLFIYRVQNGKSGELAEVLNQLFEEDEATDGLPKPKLAPGLEPVTLRSKPAQGDEKAPAKPPSAPASGEGLALPTDAKVRIVADEPNNALLVLANAQEYRQVLNAMKQLDVVPMQVLIDVTIAEVTLTDNLEYGLEWTFDNYIKTNRGDFTGTGLLDLGAGGLSPRTGFSYALTGATGVRAVLNMLAEEGNLSVLSSPSLLVLNNQEASIQVGDQVPIATQQRQDTTDPSAPIINNVEYRDTGVLLNVTPRVNPGGLVIMEVSQEVSQVSEATALGPTISNRSVKSNVAVQSGDTIVLGGLIQDQRDRGESGIPGLHKTPIIGPLFGTKSDNQRRTELLVLITPRAIADRNTALQATEEFRRKLNSLIPIDVQEAAAEQATEPTGAQP